MSGTKRRRVSEEDGEGGGDDTGLSVRFRNYVPVDEQLRKLVLPPPKVPSVVLSQHILSSWEEEEERAKAQPLNIAPRRPNFDLKRDVARKMQRLNVRTQLAIADLIRERLAAGGQSGVEANDDGGRQLADAVMAARHDRGGDSDED